MNRDQPTIAMTVSTVNPEKEPKLERCDCLNSCGDDPWLKSGKADYCEHHKKQVAMLALIEKIHWTKTTDRLPDSNETVHIFTPGEEEPVWLGFHDGKKWFLIDGFPLKKNAVTYWTPMLRGPL